jgi:hypothetical protein
MDYTKETVIYGNGGQASKSMQATISQYHGKSWKFS